MFIDKFLRFPSLVVKTNRIIKITTTINNNNNSKVLFSNFTREVSRHEDYIHIKVKDYESEISFNWLRDHCRSPKSYDVRTNQRIVDITLAKSEALTPDEINHNENELKIKWLDGHISIFKWDWLIQNTSSNNLSKDDKKLLPPSYLMTEKYLWNAESINEKIDNTIVDYDFYSSSIEGRKDAIKSLLTYGFVQINGVKDISLKNGTLDTVSRMFKIEDTLFGPSFQFTSEHQESFSDTAYTDMALGTHNDMTYLTQSSGLQVFHILQEAEVGGETLLADGFEISRQFKENNPEGYRFLSTFPIESEYIHNSSEPHEAYKNIDCIFKHSLTDPEKIIQFRYNVYDRGVHDTRRMDLKKQRLFYKNLRDLGRNYVNNRENVYQMKLMPGTVIIIDNFRVMHGRNRFVGKRIMSGCYINRADYLSRARVIMNHK